MSIDGHDTDPTPRVNPAALYKRKKRKHHIHKRRVGHVNAGQTKNEINVTPLVDVVLVLLIIFMVVTPMLHRGVHLDLPETKNHIKKNDTGEQVVVSIREDGAYIDADKLEGDKFVDRMKKELKTARPVHVRADKGLKFGVVRKVLLQIHEAGAQQVGMATEDKK